MDDVQWLDAPSSSALAFALRRLAADDLLVLLTRRLVGGAQPAGLEQALDAERDGRGSCASRRRRVDARANDCHRSTGRGGRRAAARRSLLLLAEFKHDDLAVPVLEEALREASSHAALQALIHIRLAWAERFRKGFAAALDYPAEP